MSYVTSDLESINASCGNIRELAIKLDSFDHMDIYVYLRDLNANILYKNELASSAQGGNSDENMRNKLMRDISTQSDQKAIDQGTCTTIEPFIQSNHQVECMMVRKFLIRDSNHQPCGILTMAQPINEIIWPKQHQSFGEIPISSAMANQIFCGITERESELLYLLLRGYSLSEISQHLKLSRCTIVTYFNNLKNRYSVNSKSGLLTRAIEIGFVIFVPESIAKYN